MVVEKENGHFVPGGHSRFNLFKSLLKRTVISALIFGGVWGLFQLDTSWTTSPKTVIADALHRDMDFASAAAWYERHLEERLRFFRSSDIRRMP